MVVCIPREIDGGRRCVSFRRKRKPIRSGVLKGRSKRFKRNCIKLEAIESAHDNMSNQADDASSTNTDDVMDLVELQFFHRCCRVSGREHDKFMIVMEQLVNMFKAPTSSAKINMFIANVKAYMSHKIGTLISAVMNDLIEFIAWELETHFMDEHTQMYMFQTIGKAVVDHIVSNRNNFAEYNIASTCRRPSGMNWDVGDYNSISFKYKNPRTNTELLQSRLFDSEGNLKKAKLKCDDLCKNRLTRAGIVRRWEDFTQRYKKNFNLSMPTEEIK